MSHSQVILRGNVNTDQYVYSLQSAYRANIRLYDPDSVYSPLSPDLPQRGTADIVRRCLPSPLRQKPQWNLLGVPDQAPDGSAPWRSPRIGAFALALAAACWKVCNWVT